jgi:hypothetical protein
VIQYRIEMSGGAIVNASQMNPRVVRQPGERGLGLEVEPEDVVVLRE